MQNSTFITAVSPRKGYRRWVSSLNEYLCVVYVVLLSRYHIRLDGHLPSLDGQTPAAYLYRILEYGDGSNEYPLIEAYLYFILEYGCPAAYLYLVLEYGCPAAYLYLVFSIYIILSLSLYINLT